MSAFAPICNFSSPDSNFCAIGVKHLLSDDRELAAKYDITQLIKSGHKLPAKCLIDMGTHDEFLKDLACEQLLEALGHAGQRKEVNFRWQEGYGHGMEFVSTFIEEHIAFHAHHLNN